MGGEWEWMGTRPGPGDGLYVPPFVGFVMGLKQVRGVVIGYVLDGGCVNHTTYDALGTRACSVVIPVAMFGKPK